LNQPINETYYSDIKDEYIQKLFGVTKTIIREELEIIEFFKIKIDMSCLMGNEKSNI
jgi:hypothetical protein